MRMQVPNGMMHRFQMYCQGLTFMFHPASHHHQSHHRAHYEFCTSNVHGFHVGGHSGHGGH